MPQWYYDFYLGWLDFWRDHPVAFWLTVAASIGVYMLTWRKRTRSRT